MWSLCGHFLPRTTDGYPPPAADPGVSLPMSGVGAAVRSRGRQTWRERGARVCIVPLQGFRCGGPHSGEDPGIRSPGLGGVQSGGPPVSISSLPLPRTCCPGHPEAGALHVSPSAAPPQRGDVTNCRHGTHQGAKTSSIAGFFIRSPECGGEEAQGCVGAGLWVSAWRCWERGTSCFLNVAVGDASIRASPVQPPERRQWGHPRVSTSPP